MNNLFKNATIIDLQSTGVGREVLFIKDKFLFLPEYSLPVISEFGRPDNLFFNNVLTQPIPSLFVPKATEKEMMATEPDASPIKPSTYKTSFLVFKNQKYTTVQTDHIAFFNIRNNAVSLVGFDQQEYTLNQSLDQITNSVSPDQFFRVNRKYLISFKAIKEVEHYFLRKLFVKLVIDTPDKLLIHKEKTNTFLSWMGDR
ncbi:hypothetical protein GCM10023149_24950 [Mucilaginibacter gynuensis]|uniref:HTH LytTR-type domain-containing protein n=1 Tax=Mucilaginibacter gynuensis TaxID=1302236 RepID=A0ABP8GG25_9SPHI